MQLTLVTIHVLGATIWTGGHLVLAIGVLPRALRRGAPELVAQFESSFERVGIPALLLQVVTGVWLALRRVPDFTAWFMFQDHVAALIFTKLMLLVITVGLAVDARLRLLPSLDETKLRSLAMHIVPVTILSVLFVIFGVAMRPA
ncbi:MAG: CopD family protein [Planctomycetota bacterium]|jgi:putative copper export protein